MADAVSQMAEDMSFFQRLNASVADIVKRICAEVEVCPCEGECLCHVLGQHGAVPCPPECPTRGFDICHNCYCPKFRVHPACVTERNPKGYTRVGYTKSRNAAQGGM